MDDVQKLSNCVTITPKLLAVKTFRERGSKPSRVPERALTKLCVRSRCERVAENFSPAREPAVHRGPSALTAAL
jgi:hypothetical protein